VSKMPTPYWLSPFFAKRSKPGRDQCRFSNSRQSFSNSTSDSVGCAWRWVAGLPILMVGLEAFLIEHQHLVKSNSCDWVIAGVHPIGEVLKLYPLSDEQRGDMNALIDIRNQIVHPSQVAFGKAEWPASLQWLRERKVLDGKTPQSGGDVMALLASHKLFERAVERCIDVLSVIAEPPSTRCQRHRVE
jgi:hypothetical protein